MKILRIITFIFILLLISSCGNKELDTKELTLSGNVITHELIQDGVKHEISVLNLNNPIIIDGIMVNAIELNYEESLEDEGNVTITGKVEENTSSDYGLKYILDVSSIIR